MGSAVLLVRCEPLVYSSPTNSERIAVDRCRALLRLLGISFDETTDQTAIAMPPSDLQRYKAILIPAMVGRAPTGKTNNIDYHFAGKGVPIYMYFGSWNYAGTYHVAGGFSWHNTTVAGKTVEVLGYRFNPSANALLSPYSTVLCPDPADPTKGTLYQAKPPVGLSYWGKTAAGESFTYCGSLYLIFSLLAQMIKDCKLPYRKIPVTLDIDDLPLANYTVNSVNITFQPEPLEQVISWMKANKVVANLGVRTGSQGWSDVGIPSKVKELLLANQSILIPSPHDHDREWPTTLPNGAGLTRSLADQRALWDTHKAEMESFGFKPEMRYLIPPNHATNVDSLRAFAEKGTESVAVSTSYGYRQTHGLRERHLYRQVGDKRVTILPRTGTFGVYSSVSQLVPSSYPTLARLKTSYQWNLVNDIICGAPFFTHGYNWSAASDPTNESQNFALQVFKHFQDMVGSTGLIQWVSGYAFGRLRKQLAAQSERI